MDMISDIIFWKRKFSGNVNIDATIIKIVTIINLIIASKPYTLGSQFEFISIQILFILIFIMQDSISNTIIWQ